MLLVNQNLLQKHARSFVYAINLSETGYLVLFFLTEKIYEKICLRKGLTLGNLIFKNYFRGTKNRKKPKIEIHCKQQVYSTCFFYFIFPQSQMRYYSARHENPLQQKYTNTLPWQQHVCASFGQVCSKFLEDFLNFSEISILAQFKLFVEKVW